MIASELYILSTFFFHDTATTEIYTLSLHDALPISGARDPSRRAHRGRRGPGTAARTGISHDRLDRPDHSGAPHCEAAVARSEEHTSELQSQSNLVCRLLLEKKKISNIYLSIIDTNT